MTRVAIVNSRATPRSALFGTSGGSNNQVLASGSNGQTFWSPFVRSISANGSNYLLTPDVNFQSGTGIAFAASSNTLSISATGGSSGDFLTVNEGGGDTVFAHGNTGSTETFDPTDGNVHTATLDTNCTFTLNPPASAIAACTLELYLTQDATGSRTVTWPASVSWVGGSAPVLTTTAGATDRIVLETLNGGGTWYGAVVGGSPLTTKGDLFTYSTTNTRLAVGSNGTGVYADSTQTTGNRWTLQAIAGELLMQDGVSSPPVPLETDPTGDDWIYADL